MFQLSLLMLMVVTSFMFLNISHPLAMGLILLVQTTLICLNAGLIAASFWFSYILFIIFVGGMLVLFIYVTSLASNELFSLSLKTSFYIMIIMTTMMIMLLMMDKYNISISLENTEIQKTNFLMNYLPENTLKLNKLYNFPTNMTTMLMINYLLITLVAVVKITNLKHGPLRPMN